MTDERLDFEQMGEDFQEKLRVFIEKSSDLGKNGLRRLSQALMAYPLEDTIIKLVHEDEKELYEIGKEIQSIKMNMAVESLRLDNEEAQKQGAQNG